MMPGRRQRSGNSQTEGLNREHRRRIQRHICLAYFPRILSLSCPCVLHELGMQSHKGSPNSSAPRTRCLKTSSCAETGWQDWMMRFQMAERTNSGIECKSSLSMMCARWVSTVLTEISSAAAISLLDLPSATSCAISRSRGVIGPDDPAER